MHVGELAAALVPGAGRPYPVAEGLQSRAYGIDADTGRYVLRVGTSRAAYEKDAYAAVTFARRGLPVPEVVAIGELGAYAYCLARRLPGTPVNRLAADALPQVTDALDATLHRLWTADVGASTGFGRFDHTGAGAYASWRAYLVDPAPAKAAVDQRHVPAELAAGLHAYVVERADDCPDERALLHGDFGSDNVLTDGRAVTGVLDWELAGYGDPLHDVAEILQWEGGEPCMTALAQRLRRTLPADDWRRVTCYRARICLDELARGPDATLPWMLDAATAILRT